MPVSPIVVQLGKEQSQGLFKAWNDRHFNCNVLSASLNLSPFSFLTYKSRLTAIALMGKIFHCIWMHLSLDGKFLHFVDVAREKLPTCHSHAWNSLNNNNKLGHQIGHIWDRWMGAKISSAECTYFLLVDFAQAATWNCSHMFLCFSCAETFLNARSSSFCKTGQKWTTNWLLYERHGLMEVI